uniref:F-box domain-containing protein n=1 Tax=Oryza punctata TaxID=4537 RepID=A0A0E0LGY1_ORYPU
MDSGDGRRRRRQCEGVIPTPTDSISALPDDLLHSILLSLGCARAAARTAVLSRRWRRFWATMPELHLRRSAWMTSLTSAVPLVDGALAGYSAPTLRLLDIDVSDIRIDAAGFRAAHVAPWLRFAAQCVAGEVFIRLLGLDHGWLPKHQLDLPEEVDVGEDLLNERTRPPVTSSSVGHGQRSSR